MPDELRFLLDPLFIECVVVVVLTIVGIVLARRLRRIATRLDSITALSDFIGGLNEYFRGDHDRAVRHLEKAVAADPSNVEARIALGDCQRERGELAEAHKHHTHVRTTFGVDEVENLRSLALDHELRGDHSAALAAMEEVLERLPDNLDAARAVKRLRVAVGDFAGAISPQQGVLSLLERNRGAGASDDEIEEERRELARLHALAGQAFMERNDPRAALSYLEHAVRLAPDLVGARMQMVEAMVALGEVDRARTLFTEQLESISQLAAGDGGGEIELLSSHARQLSAAGAVTREASATLLPGETNGKPSLPASSGSTSRALPVPIEGQSRDPGAALMVAGATPALTMREFLRAVLPRVAALSCQDCGHSAREYQDLCPRCDAPGTLYSIYTSERRPVPELVEIVREAAGGLEHHRALLDAAASGDGRAAQQLAELGDTAAASVFSQLSVMRNPRKGLDILVEMGPEVFGDLLDCYRRERDRGNLPRLRGVGTLEDAMIIIACEHGPQILPVMYDRLTRSRSTLLELATRVAVRMADARGLDELRREFDPRLVLDEVRALDTASCVRLVVQAHPGSTLVESTFVDASWKGEAVLAEALKDPAAFQTVLAVLARRGIHARFVQAALPLLADRAFAGMVAELATELPLDGAQELIPAATSPSTPAWSRAQLAAVLADRLSGDPTPLVEALEGDDCEHELVVAIASCGSPALHAVEKCFASRRKRMFAGLRPLARRQDSAARLALVSVLLECARSGVPGVRQLAMRLQTEEEDAEVLRALARLVEEAES